jgi:hypothetical protein
VGYELFIIDAVSPFFIKHPDTIINWSKIPFEQMEDNGKWKKKRYLKIKKNFESFIDQIADIGYNAISLDDVCHLAMLDLYDDKLQKKIKKYRRRYRKLLTYARTKTLKIFITTDIMFFNEQIRHYTGRDIHRMIAIMKQAIISVFENLKDVDGIIFRMGESDGIDVTGDFLSRVVIKTAEGVALFLSEILPIFEQYNKTLIFRTWTIGINPVGDLIWNRATWNKAFGHIDSPNFIVSMKHGEGDFFRYLKVNKHFLEDTRQKKLLEIQTRREYEGFGQFPNFVGWEYEAINQELKNCHNVVGINVWCQTGGWSRTRNFAFIKHSSFFVELNTHVVLKLFRDNQSVEAAIAEYCPDRDQQKLVRFLRLAETITENLLYSPGFAAQALYFNRVRVPPLLYVFWQSVTLTTPIVELMRFYDDEAEESVNEANKAFKLIPLMEQLNQDLKLDYDHQFFQDTFELLLLARKIIYQSDAGSLNEFEEKYQRYSEQYDTPYQFHINLPDSMARSLVKLLIPVFVRKSPDYRFIDVLLFNRFSSLLFRVLRHWFTKDLPDFVDKSAMPLEDLLR